MAHTIQFDIRSSFKHLCLTSLATENLLKSHINKTTKNTLFYFDICPKVYIFEIIQDVYSL